MEKIDLSSITEAQIAAISFLERSVRRGTWKINRDTGLIDINGDFNCSSSGIKNFSGIRFGKVTGYFNCSYNNLTSLDGAPLEVGGNFYCYNNQLKNLEGAPKEAGKDFHCSYNKLTSLAGAPQSVGGDFSCHTNKLTSLVGAPKKVSGSFDCSYNKLTNLQGIPKVGGYVEFSYNAVGKKFISLVYETMTEKKVEFWEALCMLKDDIDEVSWNKLIVGLEDKITPEAIKTYSIVSRYRNHFFI